MIFPGSAQLVMAPSPREGVSRTPSPRPVPAAGPAKSAFVGCGARCSPVRNRWERFSGSGSAQRQGWAGLPVQRADP